VTGAFAGLAAAATGDGVRLPVKVVPGASRERIVGLYGDALKVQVGAPPTGGAANARLCELLAAALCVPTRAVTIVSGASQARKSVTIAGLDLATLRARLAAATTA
jgi:uncharacterized protein